MHEKSRSDQESKHRLLPAIGVGGLVLLVLLMVGAIAVKRIRVAKERESLRAEANQGAPVEVIGAQSAPALRELDLLGEARPFLTNQLFARVSGYVRQIRVDKGDVAHLGDVLAVIESPETDKAYLSALADANYKSRIAVRSRSLRKRRLISQQEEDIAVANSRIADATLEIQKTLRDYEELRAPFDGRITARFFDPGALLQNASNSQSTQPIFTISQTEQLRVYVYVDQKDAAFVHPGTPAEVYIPERQDVRVSHPVTRVAGELDPRTRTMLAEVDIPNPGDRIVAGSFVRVRLRIEEPQAVIIPARSLVIRDGKPSVPVIDDQSELHYRVIAPGENDGQNLRVLSGLKAGEKVALNVGNTQVEGHKMHVQAAAPQAGEARPGGPQKK